MNACAVFTWITLFVSNMFVGYSTAVLFGVWGVVMSIVISLISGFLVGTLLGNGTLCGKRG